MLRTCAILLLLFTWRMQAEDFGVRVLLGVTDQLSVSWSGSVSAQDATITAVEPWRFEGGDAILTSNSWRCSNHLLRMAEQQVAGKWVPNGVIVHLKNASPGAILNIQTVQGSFSVLSSEIPYGRTVKRLSDRVSVDRVPSVTRLTGDPQEQDYPAMAAAPTGEIWLTWMEFTHSPVHDQLRTDLSSAPANFDLWTTPPGGDRIWARRFVDGNWGEPVPITNGGEDLYRPAITVSGDGYPWVIWPAQSGGNFDLWACRIVDGNPQDLTRITSEPGADIDPVAATDSNGVVWVAWQAWRDGRPAIAVSRLEDTQFTVPEVISAEGSAWNPAIATDSSGHVSVAWDSYRYGNYDVFLRTASGGVWGTEMAAAASRLYEAYPSLAYGVDGRLWVAYEEGGESWGKDWGATGAGGIRLYYSRVIRVVTLSSSGVRSALAAYPRVTGLTAQTSLGGEEALTASTRLTETNPRLQIDTSGTLWLAFRSAEPLMWNRIGYVWQEYLVSYSGTQWTQPIYLPHSDNITDNRPALIALGPGRLLAVGSSDWRQSYYLGERNPPARDKVVPDPYQNDLFANELTITAQCGTLKTQPMPVTRQSAATPKVALERAAIERVHAARLLGRYKILLGEFHRHSELSHDSCCDGSLMDQWRYIIDAAGMDWAGCCDHDNGSHREYSWWITQKLTDAFYSPGHFVPMFSYERSVIYPEGHRNVVFAQRGIHTLPRLPISGKAGPSPDTLMLYSYLRQFGGVVAAHSTTTLMGTDWRNSDPLVETSVEIFQGERQNYERAGAPRAPSAQNALGGWKPLGFVNLALQKGYKLGFESGSDHGSTHMSYANVLVEESTREAVLDAFKKRHLYASTDVILAEVSSGDQIMGDIFSTDTLPELKISLSGTAPFSRVYIIKDDKFVFTSQPNSSTVNFTWRDTVPNRGRQSYYYVRAEQQDGQIAWASPMWITYTGN